MKRSTKDLKILQALPLEVKIKKTELRIKEFYDHYDGQVYISFSGGKDSTVLLNIARKLYPGIKAMFIDTGLEYPELRQFVKSCNNIDIIRPSMNFKKVIEHYGYPIISKEQAQYIREYRTTKSPKLKDIRLNGNKWGRGRISNKWRYLIDAPFKIDNRCCDIMKKKPAKQYEKNNGLHPIIGTMTEESANRKSTWIKEGCNAFDKARPTSKPLSFWTEQNILEYIKKYNIKYADCYGDIKYNEKENLYYTTKCQRTGCIFCMFGIVSDKERFIRLKQTHPSLYTYCMKPIDRGGLGLKEVLNYINIKTE